MPEPLVSCLCVTENRPAFMPWLMWCFHRQTWPQRELVIVDSSPQPFHEAERDDVRVITAPPGTGVARKRNLALQEACGEFVAWFDDDDWQHPERLALLVNALRPGGICAGTRRAWFVDLATRHCAAYPGFKGRVIFNSALFHREAAREVRFEENRHAASDTPWMSALEARYPGSSVFLDREDLFFWLCHSTNLSNSARHRQLSQPLERLKTLIGPEAWATTTEALDALQSRLAQPTQPHLQGSRARRKPVDQPAKPAHPSTAPIVQPQSIEGKGAKGPDAKVGVMIKATILDAPYLDTMVRHMLAQARFPFAERVVVVDRRMDFSGKYRYRSRPDQQILESVLAKLLDDEVIDSVRDVDMRPALMKEIMERYFPEHPGLVPPYAFTGGPIYATLFGLESMSCDYVLQMDADVFFYSGSRSWVSQALALMQRDPGLWLMMTHPGPPAGLPGNSLGKRNASRATWDDESKLWRFNHATTRYFLCDRRRIHGRLRPIFQAGGCAPLEQCLGLGLQRHNAFRGALGDLESWHLHAWHHGDPFPQWAPTLAKLVEMGRFPQVQRGEYDLRLDQEESRRQWDTMVSAIQSSDNQVNGHFTNGVNSDVAAASASSSGHSRPHHGVDLATRQSVGSPSLAAQQVAEAPIAVIVPVRNRAGQRLCNTLSSLNWQALGRPARIIVVSHGSQPEIDRDLQGICAEKGAELVTIGAPSHPWNKSLALNTGIRMTPPDLPFVMTMDADMILAPNFLEVVLEHLQSQFPALVLCRISDLPQNAVLPTDSGELQQAFTRLHQQTRLRGQSGSGGVQAAARSFFFDIRGYDEDLLWWGAMDGDILNRARLMSTRLVWAEDRTAMLHQWHPRKHNVLQDLREIEQAKRHWLRNHELVQSRAHTLRRNPRGWGGEVA